MFPCDSPAEDRTSAQSVPQEPAARRVVIISAAVGAGHDGAAEEIALRLRSDGFLVDRHDFLELLPARLGRLLAGVYHRLLTWAPVGYQRIYAATEHTGRPGLAVRALFGSAQRRTLRAIPADTCAVVSTYPGASQVLGRLRLRGRLAVPAITYLTDFSVHALWVASGVDVHLAAHPIPAGQAHARGAAGVSVSGPLAGARFAPGTVEQRRAARARFGLPERSALALLVAGSWGVGPVERVAAEIEASGVAVPVVVCGRNEALAETLRRNGLRHVYGWVDDMPALMAATDVLVQNAGGLTSLEAFASGLPVASYRCIPGHGQTNAAALQEAGLAGWIRGPGELVPVLTELLYGSLGRQQRELGLELMAHRPVGGPAQVIAEAVDRGAPGPVAMDLNVPGPGAPARRPVRTAGRRRPRIGVPVIVATVAATLAMGIGAPLAEAYGDVPGRFGTVAHFLDGDR
ncbi:UDP-N-acetylglucosamine--N-acetylglucosamine transferase [Streptomyces sp. NPDC051322]|uniref:glycosyltransferase n=1 Tax=Streptomyces sp. NPDC051322 TaxID=3154645 RepID=UPI00344EBD7B